MPNMHIKERDGSIILSVRVIPRASRSEIVGEHNGALKVKLTSPPIEGAANEELIKILSKELDIAKAHIEIVSGHTSRIKRVRIRSHDARKIRAVLNAKTWHDIFLVRN